VSDIDIRMNRDALEYKTYKLWLIGIVSVVIIATVSCNTDTYLRNEDKKAMYQSPGYRLVKVVTE
jgi:hypothetical protein